jgi:hypothetical protein
VDVYRLAENPSAPLPLTEDEFAARATLIGSVSFEQIQKADQTLSYIDSLELAGEPARLRYAIRYVNNAGQRAAFSNFLLIEPAASIAQAPTLLGRDETESSITILWQAPTANIDGSSPANLLGYNIYRLAGKDTEAQATPINSSLVNETKYLDENFSFGQKYRYFLRAVSLGMGGTQVESSNSNTIEVLPLDVYPPSAPTSIRIAAAPGKLSLFFPANPERDVVGYRLFRSVDPNLPKNQWTLLTNSPITKTTFLDDNVESGQRYYYYLVAIDTAGNVSEGSEITSEVVP